MTDIYCSPGNPLQCVQQQLLDFNSFKVNLLSIIAHFGNVISFDILEKEIFVI